MEKYALSGYILITIIVVISIIVYVCFYTKNEGGSGGNNSKLKFYRCDQFPINEATESIFNNNKIGKTDIPEKADIYIPCGYTHVEAELKKPLHNKFIYAIKGCDSIVSKDNLWKILYEFYGRKGASEYVPNTYILRSVRDCLELLKEPEDKIFIAKKNLQRQEGILLIKRKDLNIKKLNSMKKDNFVIAQEYLDNPFIIDSRKINMRVYLLLVITGDGVLNAYIYNDGFIYYTKGNYKYDVSTDAGITTGYIDRKVYDINPLTHSDLNLYLKKNGHSPERLYSNIEKVIGKVIKGCKSRLSGPASQCSYQLFGVDIQPDKNLDVKLIEINKGPSLAVMDTRDGSVKHKLQEDMYGVVGIATETTGSNGFRKISVD